MTKDKTTFTFLVHISFQCPICIHLIRNCPPTPYCTSAIPRSFSVWPLWLRNKPQFSVSATLLSQLHHPATLLALVAVVPLLSRVRLCNPMHCSTPGFPVLHQLPELTQTHAIESGMPSSHLIFCCPLLLLPSIFRIIRVFFQWVSSSHQGGQTIGASASASVLPMNIRVDFL